MTTTQEQKMGRFSVEEDLANNEDLVLARAGVIPKDQIRRARVCALVDSRAGRLVIPRTVAQQLGLQTPTTAGVPYADGQRSVAKAVHLAYGDRESVFHAVVEPDRNTALIGAVVLGELDLLVDCTAQRLVPRDPKQIVCEI
jgi:hypothetical protein